MIALAVTLLLDGGGTRAMSIARKALKFAMRPLLNERHQTGLVEGRIEGRTEGRVEGRTEGLIEGRTETQKEWEEWLERQRQDGTIDLRPDDPPPGTGPR